MDGIFLVKNMKNLCLFFSFVKFMNTFSDVAEPNKFFYKFNLKIPYTNNLSKPISVHEQNGFELSFMFYSKLFIINK